MNEPLYDPGNSTEDELSKTLIRVPNKKPRLSMHTNNTRAVQYKYAQNQTNATHAHKHGFYHKQTHEIPSFTRM